MSSPATHAASSGVTRVSHPRPASMWASLARDPFAVWICVTVGVNAIALGYGRLVRGTRGMVACLGLNYTDRSVW